MLTPVPFWPFLCTFPPFLSFKPNPQKLIILGHFDGTWSSKLNWSILINLAVWSQVWDQFWSNLVPNLRSAIFDQKRAKTREGSRFLTKIGQKFWSYFLASFLAPKCSPDYQPGPAFLTKNAFCQKSLKKETCGVRFAPPHNQWILFVYSKYVLRGITCP